MGHAYFCVHLLVCAFVHVIRHEEFRETVGRVDVSESESKCVSEKENTVPTVRISEHAASWRKCAI
jgi:hypothetical protein